MSTPRPAGPECVALAVTALQADHARRYGQLRAVMAERDTALGLLALCEQLAQMMSEDHGTSYAGTLAAMRRWADDALSGNRPVGGAR